MKAMNIEPYLSAWEKRAKAEEEGEKKTARKVLEVVHRIAKTLVKEGKARRVYLFGSLALFTKGQRGFTTNSDIDLAGEEVPKEEYFRILAEVNRMSDFDVDLIDLDGCPPPLKEAILKNGVLLYGKEGGDSLSSVRLRAFGKSLSMLSMRQKKREIVLSLKSRIALP